MTTVSRYISNLRPILIVLYLASMGMLCVSSVQLYLGQDLQPLAGLILMGIVFGIYVFNRFTDIKEDFANDIGKYLFFTQRKMLFQFGIVVLTAALATLVVMQKLRLYHIVLIALGIVYSYRLVPWYRKGHGFIFLRLKEIPFVKNILVSGLWGVSVFAIPILFAEVSLPDPVAVGILAAALAVSTFNNTLFSDIKDQPGDEIAHNQTVPVLIGTANSYTLMATLTATWIAIASILFVYHKIDLPHYAFLWGLALYPCVYIAAYHLKKVPRTAAEILCESDLLLFAAGMAVMTMAQN